MWRGYPLFVQGNLGAAKPFFAVIPSIPNPYDDNDLFSSFNLIRLRITPEGSQWVGETLIEAGAGTVIGVGIGRQRLPGGPEQPVDLESVQHPAALGQCPAQ